MRGPVRERKLTSKQNNRRTQTPSQGPFARDCGPSTRRARRRRPPRRAVFDDRSTRGRRARGAARGSNHGVRQTRRRTRRVRCGAPRKRKARNSRPPDARVATPRTDCGAAAERSDATRGTYAPGRTRCSAASRMPARSVRAAAVAASSLSSALCSLSLSLFSLGPSALSRRAPQWGPCCFVCCLVFFRELGPSNAFLIRKLTPYTPLHPTPPTTNFKTMVLKRNTP